ncbi:PfkB family carbohydrate kinase [Pseudonocardia bannensis]|uniref:Bifunctional heptose 7-phosphate kinase/heptose 1-phosphate adenyltransferase n=1 Tax=Pseudonocardia bannensis TaxID=630973 RepID=A0A848DB25_9PSEU|nr:PfkB family carbohydrate kinase [Pseudonocardia bannensis]NMH90012.1 bifunctional heptose 7-phosphate kinase/heptose 1-phosphate adenyltransferase [Pseudonocardia bannensis]
MRSVVVVGDAMLDVDVDGHSDRLCPDAPAPVLNVTGETTRPGGAGLAAVLLAAGGPAVTFVTALAEDEPGDRLRELLGRAVQVVAGPAEGGTVVKCRWRAGGRPLLRTDRGEGRPGAGFGATVAGALESALARAGALLVSDYGHGVSADPVVGAAVARAVARGTPVVWDPHPRGPAPVPGATVATPNLGEARAAVANPDGGAATLPEVFALAGALLARWGCGALAITLGERGAAVAHRHGARAASPAPVVTGGDPCGAGDAFAARLATLLATGSTVDDAVDAAVTSATAFVARGGAGAVRWDGDRWRQPDDRPAPGAAARPAVLGLDTARELADRVRAAGGTVVASGGCFDLLHTGHSRTLAAARALGDCLLVLLNSDASVRRLKGPGRPVVPAPDRAELLAALECVDGVVVFDEDDPRAALDVLRPDLWVKGGDYDPADLLETPLVRSWGGEVVAVPYRPGRSTTRLVAAAAGMAEPAGG